MVPPQIKKRPKGAIFYLWHGQADENPWVRHDSWPEQARLRAVRALRVERVPVAAHLCDGWECAIPVVPPLFASLSMRGFLFAIWFVVFYYLGVMKYIDAHCHILTDTQMRDATAHSVAGFVVNATCPAYWDTIVELTQRGNVFGAIGAHPWFVSDLSDGWDYELINALAAHSDLMVGEIGLDKNRPDPELQETVFCRGLQIARDMRRVAHIHCVGAWGKMMDILRGVDLPPAMVFHAYSGSVELVRELTDMGAYFSFGAEICNEKHTRARNAVAAVPISRILVESDAPDVAMPNTIPAIVAEIAKIRGVDTEQLTEIIYKNTLGVINDGKI